MNNKKSAETSKYLIRPIEIGDDKKILPFVDRNRAQIEIDHPIFSDHFLSCAHAKEAIDCYRVKAEAAEPNFQAYVATDTDNKEVYAFGTKERLGTVRALALGGISLYKSNLRSYINIARLSSIFIPEEIPEEIGDALYASTSRVDARTTGVQERGAESLTFTLIRPGNLVAEALATRVGMARLARHTATRGIGSLSENGNSVTVNSVRSRFAGVTDGVRTDRVLWVAVKDDSYPNKLMR